MPREFYSPEQVYQAVASRLRKIRLSGLSVDYLSFVPDGEPTLDSRLGESIDALRGFAIPVAVITNATLLWRADVRARLNRADLVSIKVDSVDESAWRKINLPHWDLRLDLILQGIRDFAAAYKGILITDTMLIAGINDSRASVTATADFLAGISPRTAYLAVPTRPTTVAGIQGADETGLVRAHQIFSARLTDVELLTGQEMGDFAYTGNAEDDLLAITAVHPMRERSLRDLLAKDHADWSLVESLLFEGRLKVVEHNGELFYLRPVRCHRQAF